VQVYCEDRGDLKLWAAGSNGTHKVRYQYTADFENFGYYFFFFGQITLWAIGIF
jgi:hypothetical protein